MRNACRCIGETQPPLSSAPRPRPGLGGDARNLGGVGIVNRCRPGRIADAGRSPLHAAYGAAKLKPHASRLDYIFRAITPSHSPIRFNTRFFLVDAELARGTLRRTGELEDIGWRPVSEAINDLDLRLVTRLALLKATALWRKNPSPDPSRRVKRLWNRKYLRLIALE